MDYSSHTKASYRKIINISEAIRPLAEDAWGKGRRKGKGLPLAEEILRKIQYLLHLYSVFLKVGK